MKIRKFLSIKEYTSAGDWEKDLSNPELYSKDDEVTIDLGKIMLPIGIAGQAGSGKSTLARQLKERFGYAEIISFAAGLKRAAIQLGWDGQKDEKGRKLLQTLGTECGRNCIDEDIWVKTWLVDCNQWMCKSGYSREELCHIVIADDVRFMNEFEKIQDLGGVTVKIYGRDQLDEMNDESQQHPSETGLPDHIFDFVVPNGGDVSDLSDHADAIALAAQEKYAKMFVQ